MSSGVVATACCCSAGGGTPCDCQPICDSNIAVREVIEYLTVGKAILPTKYPGQFWAAWHNNLNKKCSITADIELVITKRTSVQADCGGGSCAATAGLSTAASCADVGTIADDVGCKRTVYTENIIWNFDQKLFLSGGIPEQSGVFVGSVLTHYDGFPGALPCGISQPCNTCLGALNEALVFGDPAWIAKENRKLIPRWGEVATPVNMNDVMSTAYPVTAVCDKVNFVSACDATASEVVSSVCVDYPIIVMPSQSGNNCAGDPQACDDDSPQNGADTVLWGLDIVADSLTARLNGISFPTNVGMGVWNDFWVVRTSHGRFRMLFNMGAGMGAGTTKSPKDGMSYVKTAILDLGNETYRIDAKVSITTADWSYASRGCHCHTSQPAENNKPVISLRVDLPNDENNLCGAPGLIELNVNAGLEECYRPGGPFGWDACYAWDLLPNATPYAGDPSGIRATYRYLGVTPVERGHPNWVKWRERYNHTETVNNWWNGAATSNDGLGCPPPRSGASTIMPSSLTFHVGFHKAYKCGYSPASEGVCPPELWCCSCAAPTFPLDFWPEGCYAFKKTDFDNCAVVRCDPICSGCSTYGGGGGVPGLPFCINGCSSVSIPLPPVTCQAFSACVDNPGLNYSMRIRACGATLYEFCYAVALTQSSSYSAYVGMYPDWIWKWDPHTQLHPAGTYNLYQITDDTCNDPRKWRLLSTITIA